MTSDKTTHDHWEENGIKKPQSIIVCAANKLPNGLIICGARHWDNLMREQADAAGWFDNRCGHEEQGFIDQFGEWYNREDALKVVLKSGQPFNAKRNGCNKELFSEGLY